MQNRAKANHDLGKGSMVPLAKLLENQSSYFQIVTSI